MLALRAQTGIVFLTYRARPEIDSLVSEVSSSEPLYDFVANDGIRHTVWRVPDPDPFVAAFQAVPNLYIADGHHRVASASLCSLPTQGAGLRLIGTEDFNFVWP